MAILRVNKLGTVFNSSSGVTSCVLPVTATTTVGNRVIVPVVWGLADRSTAMTDSQGNSYVQEAVIVSSGNFNLGRVFSARMDSPLVNGVDTISAIWSGGAVNAPMMAAYEYSGIAPFAPLDVSQVTYGVSQSPNSGSVVTNFANELVFGVVTWQGALTFGSPSNTELDDIVATGHSLETQELIVSSTGTYSVSGHLSPTPGGNWAVAVLTYSDTSNSSSLVPVATTTPVITGSGVVGMQLTCSQGIWTNAPTAYSYQWKRAGTNVATGAHYLVTTADVGQSLSCVVTASNKYAAVTATASNTVTPAVNKTQIGLGI